MGSGGLDLHRSSMQYVGTVQQVHFYESSKQQERIYPTRRWLLQPVHFHWNRLAKQAPSLSPISFTEAVCSAWDTTQQVHFCQSSKQQRGQDLTPSQKQYAVRGIRHSKYTSARAASSSQHAAAGTLIMKERSRSSQARRATMMG